MKTILEANLPISHVLIKAVEFLQEQPRHGGEIFQIVPCKDKQSEFLNKNNHPNDLDLFSKEELRSKVSPVTEDINSWLKENGYNITLQPVLNDPYSFAVASILEVATEWLKKGEETSIPVGPSLSYKAFKLSDMRIAANHIKNYPHPKISIRTRSNDTVEFLKSDGLVTNPLKMYEFACDNMVKNNLENVWGSSSVDRGQFSTITIPELNIDVRPDISWLVDLKFASEINWYRITEALQQIKFKMNKVGTEVKTAVAIQVVSGSICISTKDLPSYVVDSPFYIWITRKGLVQPYFSGHIGLESFQEQKITL